ncbi:glutathione S-transferase C-terminal domain-containing protein homolog [Chrysoperla carnea]|uniref:glutathione S-transferase C-terminal domain-containing protein homolog n=1 Tax=Chrysoperla carnea TaxID=189513 RepID=UPI001D06409A|nr:glutathione S-transferase C-terminal domain-containing protein homolog [Chrysoperla carnea]
MCELYIKYYDHLRDNLFEVPLESLITLFICKYLTDVKIKKILIKDSNSRTFKHCVEINDYEFSETSVLCEMPCIYTKNTIIAGLCAVNREIIKNSQSEIDLLGFKSACLKAPNETSIWTKFCEIDMISTTNYLICDQNLNNIIPEDIIRLENHMCQPVRIHNMYKIAQNENKTITFQTPKNELNISHKFVEGPFMTIADLILWPQLYLIFNKFNFSTEIPLTYKWYENLSENTQIQKAISIFKVTKNICTKHFEKPFVKSESLYKADPKRYKPQNRIYTKQNDIDKALNIATKLSIESPGKPFGHEIEFDWNTIPIEANPNGGALPVSRADRKCEQLENLAKSVIKLAKAQDTIVDFCSGSGHLGILLAVKLPNCLIILLENKEESLSRAKDRVEKLQLENVKFLQCNLDYFSGDFNIGVSLHACGVATDLVIQHCLRRNAAFVCCPCCYGGVHDCHHLTYPRSRIFRESGLTLKDYLVLGHSADQTHGDEHVKSKQGNLCMNIIDTDRMFQAKEFKYAVCLGKLEPNTCTPKNNLVVGWPDDQNC